MLLDQAVHPYMEQTEGAPTFAALQQCRTDDVYLKYFEFFSKVTTVCLLSSLLFIPSVHPVSHPPFVF